MLVVSEEDRGGGPDQPLTSIQATFLDRRTGQSSTFAVAPSEASQILPEVAVAGDTYLVAWFEGDELRGRIIRDGVREAIVELSDEGFRSASVASDGRDFFVAWFAFPRGVLATAKISADGAILDRAAPIPVSAPYGVPGIAIACGRDECLLAWRDVTMTGWCRNFVCIEESVLAARMSTSLRMRDAIPIVLTKIQYGIGEVTAAAANDGTYAVAWDVAAVTVRAREIDAFGTPGAIAERDGTRATIARQGDAWLLLRDTSRDADARVAATRFRDAAAVDFSVTPADAQTRMHASAANDGARVVVVYERTTRGEAASGPPRVYVETIAPPPPKARAVRR
jgi:hypothetical protein